MQRDFRAFGIELVEPDLLEDEPVANRLAEGEGGKVIPISLLRKVGAA